MTRAPLALGLLLTALISENASGRSPTAAAPPTATANLPAAATQLLDRLKLPPSAISVVVRDPASGFDRLALHAERPVNPASIIKLLTTYAALEQLGPSWTWRTPVWLNGTIEGAAPDGVLAGDVHIKGRGDPKLSTERLWAMLQRIRALGIIEIRGDIILDQSAFAAPPTQPGDFDGEPLKPYNVQAQALMINQRTLTYGFVPDKSQGVARITVEPELAELKVDATLPLSHGPCQDWRAEVKAQLQDPNRVRFTGRYPLACGERTWHVAYSDPTSFDRRLIEALWRSMGGRLRGRVREGPSPSTEPSFEWSSPPLADVARDINRFSNNTMAQMLAMSLAAQQSNGQAPVTAEHAQRWLQEWAQARLPGSGVIIDNGSGLSRHQRISAHQIAALLQQAWKSPVLPEFIGSLPVTGDSDGTLRRWQHLAGRAHLKTGSLRDVVGVAGYVLGRSGQRWIVVAVVQHERAQEARPLLDALVKWTAEDAPVRSNLQSASP